MLNSRVQVLGVASGVDLQAAEVEIAAAVGGDVATRGGAPWKAPYASRPASPPDIHAATGA